MSKIPGTDANKEKKMEQGTDSGYGTGSTHTSSGDFACYCALHMLTCISAIHTSPATWTLLADLVFALPNH